MLEYLKTSGNQLSEINLNLQEDLLPLILSGDAELLQVTADALVSDGSFSAYLTSLEIPMLYHNVIARVNGLKRDYEFKYDNQIIVIPDINKLDELITEVYLDQSSVIDDTIT